MAAALHAVTGAVVGRVLMGIASALLARLLGPADFGVYGTVIGVVSLGSTAALLGQGVVLTKFIPPLRHTDRAECISILLHVLLLAFAVTAVVSTALVLGAGWLAQTFYAQPGLATFFHWTGLLLLAAGLYDLGLSGLAASQMFSQFRQGIVLRNAAILVLSIIGALLLGTGGALAAFGLASLISFTWIARKLLREWGPVRRSVAATLSMRRIGRQVAFAAPWFFGSMLVGVAFWVGNTLLVRYHGLADAGLFNSAFVFYQVILFVPASLTAPIMSFLSSATAEGETAFNSLASQNLRLFWLISLPIVTVASLGGYAVLPVIFGMRYRAACVDAGILAAAALLAALLNVVGPALVSLGRVRAAGALSGIWFVAFVAAAFLLVPRYGAHGLAFTFLASYAIYTGCIHFRISSMAGVSWQGTGTLALISAAVFVAALLLHSLTVGHAAAAGVALACAALALEWRLALRVEERRLIVRALHKLSRRTFARPQTT